MYLKVSIPVYQYALSGEFIQEWPSVVKAARHFNVSSSMIISVTKGRRWTAATFQWRDYKQKNIQGIKKGTKKWELV